MRIFIEPERLGSSAEAMLLDDLDQVEACVDVFGENILGGSYVPRPP